MYDVIIIGGSAAGLSAAIYTFRKNMDTLIVAKEIGGQVAKSGEIENYLGVGKITGPGLAMKFREHIDMLGIPYEEGVEARGISGECGKFTVSLDDSRELHSKLIIIASGKNPKKLNIPGEEKLTNKGISYCATCDGPLFRNKTVAVIGGGNSALDAAVQFLGIAQKIYVLNINPEFTGDPILIDKVKDNSKVEVIHNAKTVEILGDNIVSGLKYRDLDSGAERIISINGVFVEIGQVPSIAFDKKTLKNKWGMIEIKANNETSIAGIFAAGDVTSIRDNQISVAVGEGTKAALSAYEFWVHNL